MKHEKLIRAMSEIDEDLILEAHEERRAATIWIRYGAIAACLLLAVLIVPQILQNSGRDFFPVSKDEVDMEVNGIFNGASAEASGEKEYPKWDRDENVPEEPVDASSGSIQSGVQDGEINNEALIAQIKESELTKLLDEQGGAYSLETVIENEYGKVMFTNRSKSTVTVKATLLKDVELSVFSATSGVWRLTVNGETVEAFPNKAGVYEIVIDFSNDASLNLIYVGGFGVFSIGAE